MGLTIITGTHTFIDLGRKFRQAFINATHAETIIISWGAILQKADLNA